MEKLVSVIVPVYNAEKYVGTCIESLLNQTYKEIEIICVDDGSKDSSGSICDSYAKNHSNIIVIHQENGGVSAARNKGLKFSHGQYYFFVDSDDVVPLTAIDTLCRKMEEYNADMVVGNAVVEVTQTFSKKYFNIPEDKVFEGNDVIKNAAASIFSSVWGKLFSKQIIEKLNFHEGKKINEDGFFVFQCLLECKKAVLINDVVYNYLYHSGSASHSTFSEKYYDIIYFRDKADKLMNEYYPDMKALSNAVYLKYTISFLNQLVKTGLKERREEINAVRKDIAKHSKPLGYLTFKERIKLILIKYAIGIYAMIMRRG